MDLLQVYNQLQFWINKKLGAWFNPSELDSLTDFGQLSYYKDCYIKYGSGQRLTDAMAPFKVTGEAFTTDANGLLTTRNEYMDLIDLIPMVNAVRATCPIINEDEVTNRINSQLIPLSLTSPIAELVTNWDIQLYPQVQQSGIISYFMRPPAPKFVYTTVSGRVIVYDKNNSTQLLWGDDEIQSIIIKALQSIGINLSDQELLQWSEAKDQQNLMTTMKI